MIAERVDPERSGGDPILTYSRIAPGTGSRMKTPFRAATTAAHYATTRRRAFESSGTFVATWVIARRDERNW